jgi:hypothetical protein
MSWNTEWAKQIFEQNLRIAGQGCEEFGIRWAVVTKSVGSRGYRSFLNGRRSIVQRMGEWHGRKYPLKSKSVKWQLLQERRGHAKRVNRRTNVVAKSRQGQRQCPCAAAKGRIPFDDKNAAPGSGNNDSRRQAIWPGPDHHGIICYPTGNLHQTASLFKNEPQNVGFPQSFGK